MTICLYSAFLHCFKKIGSQGYLQTDILDSYKAICLVPLLLNIKRSLKLKKNNVLGNRTGNWICHKIYFHF